MREISTDELDDMLAKDYVGRNKQLNSLIDVINNTQPERSPVIALNSPWGSGKTVFVKHIVVLNESDNLKIPGVQSTVMNTFQKKFTTYYFNAWENDYIGDPLEALLLNIINDMQNETDGLQEGAAKKALKVIDPAEFIKNKTDGLINFKNLTEPDELIKEAANTSKRKETISSIVKDYLSYKEKRLIFIVDELDRCKPSFAINLLEVFKHYFADHGIVFIFSIDAMQLSYTVKKYYGSNFNGSAYLDRFFDFTMSLQKPDKDRYIREFLNVHEDGLFINNVPGYIADYLDLSLRETEHFVRSLKFVEGYMYDESGYSGRDHLLRWFGKLWFIPFALGLKIKDYDKFEMFINGRGRAILEDLITRSVDMQSDAYWQLDPQENKRPLDEVIEIVTGIYDQIFTRTDLQNDFFLTRTRSRVIAAMNIIGSYTTINRIP